MKATVSFCLIFTFLISTLFSQDKKGVLPIDQNPEGSITTTRAVVIGISDYQDEKIPDLQYAHKDAEAFVAYLQSPAGGTLASQNIQLLTNKQATGGKMFTAFDWLNEKSEAGDRAIIFFSGHGDVERITKFQLGYLLPYNSPPLAYPFGAFSLEFLQAIISTLAEKNVQVILITDACRSGKLAGSNVGGAQATAANLAKQFANEIKIMSCQPNEFSLEGVQWGGGSGAFSYHLTNGLFGLADNDEDLNINLLELENYLEKIVPLEVAPHSQIPMTVGNKSTVISRVDENILTALIERKSKEMPAISPIDTKGYEELLLTKADSNFQKMYQQFIAALESGNLLEPADSSAYDLYQILSKEKSMSDFHGLMKRNLAAALHDEPQEAINAYLQADSLEMARRYNQDKKYNSYPIYLQKAAEILGPEHYMYNNLLAKQHYYQGLNLRLASEDEAYHKKAKDSLLNKALKEQTLALQYENKASFIYNEIGLLYGRLYQYENAFEYYKIAIEWSPDWMIPYYNLGVTLQKINRSNEAEKMYKKALSLDSTLTWPYWELGDFYRKINRLNEAEKMYKKVIALDSTDIWAYLMLGSCYIGTNKFNEAEKMAKKAIELELKFYWGYVQLGRLYYYTNRIAEAEKMCKMAVDVNQMEHYCDDILIRIYSQTGRDNRIKDLILKLEAQDTKDPFVLSVIAFGYIHLKDYKKADEHFQQAIKLNPYNGFPYYYYACYFALQNKQIEALDMLEEAILKDINYLFIRKDNYLDNIRETEGFKALMTKYFPEQVKN